MDLPSIHVLRHVRGFAAKKTGKKINENIANLLEVSSAQIRNVGKWTMQIGFNYWPKTFERLVSWCWICGN